MQSTKLFTKGFGGRLITTTPAFYQISKVEIQVKLSCTGRRTLVTNSLLELCTDGLREYLKYQIPIDTYAYSGYQVLAPRKVGPGHEARTHTYTVTLFAIA